MYGICLFRLYFWVILGLGGALCALRGAPRPRVLFSHRFWEVFWRRLGTIWAPRGSKERLESFKDVVWEGPWRMFGKSSGPKAALWRPRSPKGSKKEHFGCLFGAFFTKSMKTEKCVWTAQACTDCIWAHPKIINFRWFYSFCVKFLPGGHFGEDFWGFLLIFEDFGCPLRILFGIICLIKGHLFQGPNFD